jgi:hypothetical protein
MKTAPCTVSDLRTARGTGLDRIEILGIRPWHDGCSTCVADARNGRSRLGIAVGPEEASVNQQSTIEWLRTRSAFLSCIVCERPLGTHRLDDVDGVIVKCPRCGALQHRHRGTLR